MALQKMTHIMYRQFDKDGSHSLTIDECEQFAKKLYEVASSSASASDGVNWAEAPSDSLHLKMRDLQKKSDFIEFDSQTLLPALRACDGSVVEAKKNSVKTIQIKLQRSKHSSIKRNLNLKRSWMKRRKPLSMKRRSWAFK